MAKTKCAITNKPLDTTFLGKPLGTMIKVEGQKYWISAEAQSQYNNDKKAILEAISSK